MMGAKMDELMIVAISRAAQLAYVEEAHGAFTYLSTADRFFRYHVSADKTATLGEELQRLGDLAAIDGSFSITIAAGPGGPGDSGQATVTDCGHWTTTPNALSGTRLKSSAWSLQRLFYCCIHSA